MKHKIIPVTKEKDIPRQYRNNPVGRLLEYQNLNRPFDVCSAAKILIGMCIDNRKHLRIPEKFAFIIRAGGANLQASEFKISYAIAVGKVRHIALIGHSRCGMVNLASRKKEFIQGLVQRAGWRKEAAERHFMEMVPKHEIGNAINFIASEAKRLKKKYPRIKVAPLYYRIEDCRLYYIR